jgi:hypothetical protein
MLNHRDLKSARPMVSTRPLDVANGAAPPAPPNPQPVGPTGCPDHAPALGGEASLAALVNRRVTRAYRIWELRLPGPCPPSPPRGDKAD